MAHWLVRQGKHSVRRVCRLLGLSQSVYRYVPILSQVFPPNQGFHDIGGATCDHDDSSPGL